MGSQATSSSDIDWRTCTPFGLICPVLRYLSRHKKSWQRSREFQVIRARTECFFFCFLSRLLAGYMRNDIMAFFEQFHEGTLQLDIINVSRWVMAAYFRGKDVGGQNYCATKTWSHISGLIQGSGRSPVTCVQVGNGESTSFLKSKWTTNCPLCFQFPALLSHALRPNISTLIVEEEVYGC
ncbi:hypothetical protein ACQJBY_028650 [Aegilops geniculata]